MVHPLSICSFGAAPWALWIWVWALVNVLVYRCAVAVTFDRRFSRPSVACLVSNRLWAGFAVSRMMLLVMICVLLDAIVADIVDLSMVNMACVIGMLVTIFGVWVMRLRISCRLVGMAVTEATLSLLLRLLVTVV